MNIKDLLKSFSIPTREAHTHHHVTEGWIGADCPFCSPKSGRYRLGFHLSSNRVSCWMCGGHGLLKTLEALTGESYKAVKALIGDVSPSHESIERKQGKLAIPQGVGPLLKPHRDYLKWRGFDPDEIAEVWGVQGIGIAGKLAWHLFIPICHEGEMVSWTTRSISREGDKRYRNAEISQERVSAKSLLYGMDFVRDRVAVVEGCTDVWAIGKGAVATMGVRVTSAQLTLLSQFTHRCVCFDNEPDAQRRAKKLCDQLEVFPGTTMSITFDGKDAASLSKRGRRELREAVFSS